MYVIYTVETLNTHRAVLSAVTNPSVQQRQIVFKSSVYVIDAVTSMLIHVWSLRVIVAKANWTYN
jgi:hypothetical protein